MTTTLANLIAYCVQFGVLALAALAVTRLVGLRTPLPALRFWQLVFVAAIVLPFVQPSAVSGAAIDSVARLTAVADITPIDSLVTGTVDVARWLLSIAAAGVAVRILWLTLGLLRIRVIARRAEPATTLRPLLDDLSAALSTSATIALSDDVETPATVGVIRPLILVPRRLLILPHAIQRAVLAHELIHVRRRDWLHTIAEECWCALLWFHPAARLIASRLSLARETVVDEATILLTRDRRAYAEALLAFANPQPHLPGVIALIGRHHLRQRISLIAEEAVMTRRRLAVSLAIALLVAGTATSAAVAAFPMSGSSGQTVVYEPGDGVSLPVVVSETKPQYTAAAMEQRIQGSVWMDVVVDETGDVSDVKVSKSLDAEYGLDNEAVAAAYKWKFKPGMKDGKPVRVRVVVEMTFTLKK